MASGVVMILLATTDAESRVTHLRPASMLAIHRQTTTPRQWAVNSQCRGNDRRKQRHEATYDLAIRSSLTS